MIKVEHVVASQCKLGEGPLWHPIDHVFYWLDILNGNLHWFDPGSGQSGLNHLGIVTGSMGVRQAGGFVMATKNGFGFWDPRKSVLEFIGNPDPDEGEARFNDGKTDRQGRFWAGKMSEHPDNSLFRLDHNHSIHRMESGIGISNGLGWSPDNRTFYFTDSNSKTISAYDFDPETGDISNRRVFVQVSQEPAEGFPDGLAVDAEGCIWSARWGGWKVVRYTPDGIIDRVIPVPVEFPTSCAFGGPNLNELYITSAWVEVDPARKADQPMAGDVFRLTTNTRGLPEPLFLG